MILEIKNGKKVFGDKLIWENLNLQIESGKIIGLIGANGSGKTTLFKAILDVIKLSEGEIITGLDIKKDVGFLLEIDLFNYLSAAENLKILGYYAGYDYTKEEIANVLTKVGLAETGKKKVGAFSFGMKQRLRLAAAIIVPRKLLILDEPLVGLDPNGIADFLATIQDIAKMQNTSIVISTHQIAEMSKLFDSYYFIKNHNLLEGVQNEDSYQMTLKGGSQMRFKHVKALVEKVVELAAQDIEIIKIENQENIIDEVFLND
ncbi:hypothetical protein RyT2_04120 [Pseudolactococcus yaeyamensis]